MAMTLIYYKNKDGKVYHFHLPTKEMTPEKLKNAMERFNEKGDAKVYTREIEEGSLEMLLVESAMRSKLFPKQAIMDALDAIAEARDAIECLNTED